MQPFDRSPDAAHSHHREEGQVARTLMWVGIGLGVVGLSAAIAYVLVRNASARRLPDDPTSARIQQLIDEANSLLKTLDEQRNSA